MRTWAQLVLQHQAGKALWHIEKVLSGRLAAGGSGGGAAAGGQAQEHCWRNAVTRSRHQVRLHARQEPAGRGLEVRRSTGLSLLPGGVTLVLGNETGGL